MKFLILALFSITSFSSLADTIVYEKVKDKPMRGSYEYRLELKGSKCFKTVKYNDGWFKGNGKTSTETDVEECKALQDAKLVKKALGSCKSRSEKVASSSGQFTRGGSSSSVMFTKDCLCLRVGHGDDGWFQEKAETHEAVSYDYCSDVISEENFQKILDLNL